MRKMSYAWVAAALIIGSSCAGVDRMCTSSCANSLGADWLIVQYRVDGAPINCWSLNQVSVTNEESSDGIYWKAEGGNLVHVGGWYNRVQVASGQWDHAASTLNIDLKRCLDGAYLSEESAPAREEIP